MSMKETILFRSNNLIAVLQALPHSDGTYSGVIEQIKEVHGEDIPFSVKTLGQWLARGHKDLRHNRKGTPYARFAARFDAIKAEHCTFEMVMNREVDEAFAFLDSHCECGERLQEFSDGSLGKTCWECANLDVTGR